MCFLLSAQWGANWDPVLRGRIKRNSVFMAVRPTAPSLCWARAAMLLPHPEHVGGVLSAETDQLKHIWILIFRYLNKYSDTPRLLSPWDSSGKNTGVGLSFPSPGGLPDPGIELWSPALQADSSPSELPGKSIFRYLLENSSDPSSQQPPYTASKQVWEPPPK